MKSVDDGDETSNGFVVISLQLSGIMIQHVRINYDVLDALSAIGGLAYILFRICTLLCSI